MTEAAQQHHGATAAAAPAQGTAPGETTVAAMRQQAVSARRARDGETVLALNEKEYVLDSTMTVITGAYRKR